MVQTQSVYRRSYELAGDRSLSGGDIKRHCRNGATSLPKKSASICFLHFELNALLAAMFTYPTVDSSK